MAARVSFGDHGHAKGKTSFMNSKSSHHLSKQNILEKLNQQLGYVLADLDRWQLISIQSSTVDENIWSHQFQKIVPWGSDMLRTNIHVFSSLPESITMDHPVDFLISAEIIQDPETVLLRKRLEYSSSLQDVLSRGLKKEIVACLSKAERLLEVSGK